MTITPDDAMRWAIADMAEFEGVIKLSGVSTDYACALMDAEMEYVISKLKRHEQVSLANETLGCMLAALHHCED